MRFSAPEHKQQQEDGGFFITEDVRDASGLFPNDGVE